MKQNTLRNIQIISLTIIVVVLCSPLLLMFASSLKTNEYEILKDFGSLKAFYVTDPTLKNFHELLLSDVLPFGRYIINSFIIVSCTVFGGIIINSMAGYTLAIGKFPYKNIILTFLISVYIIPFEAIVIPLLLVVNKMGIMDTLTVQIVPKIANAFFIYLFYQFFMLVPKDLAEAAKTDGASFFQTYWRIYIPLSIPTMATVAILQALESWNDYLWPLMVARADEARPISIGVAMFFTEHIKWDKAMAASVLMMIPILILYLVFQRWFIQSLMGSAVKG